MAIQLAGCLRRDSILPQLAATSKTTLLQELAAPIVADLPAALQQQAVQILKERETLGSTATGNGVAIPHGKVPGLSEVRVGFGRHPQGIDFGAPDDKPVHLLFVILAPSEQQGVHLQLLARISRIVSSEECRKALLDAADAAALYDHILNCDEHTKP